MNERIKELIEQSTTREKGPPVLGPFECYNSELIVFNKEKFAELIIKDCIEVFSSYGFNGNEMPIEDIRNRFGVSE